MRFKIGDYVRVSDCSGLDSLKIGRVIRIAKEGDGIPGISVKTIQGKQIEMFRSRLHPIAEIDYITAKLLL